MKVELKKIFRCDSCNKKMFMKHAMERHEQHCQSNSANVPACFSCRHLTTTTEIEESEYGDRRIEFPFVCSKKDDLIMHNKKSEVLKRHWIKVLGTELMPSKCEFKEW